jgi:hypothetical protein
LPARYDDGDMWSLASISLLQVGQKEREQAKEFFESAAGKVFETTVANEAKAGGKAFVLLQLFYYEYHFYYHHTR